MMLLGWPGSVAAQERTLFDGPVETGTFGSAAVKVTSLRDEAAVLVGGRGGLVINHSFLLGAGAYGVVSEFDAPDGVRPEEGPLDIAFGYGGLELEYRFFPQSVGHFGVSTLVGGGAIHYVKDANRLGRRE
jgi:hypothetical protein